jgi:hypothetical protein
MAKKVTLGDVAVKEPSKSKSKNPVIPVDGEFATNIVEYNDLQNKMKSLKARQDEIGTAIRMAARDQWTARALEGKTENIKFAASEENDITYIVLDSYAKVNEEALASIEAAGLGEYIERDQIQLASNLSEETQARILSALVKEFGKDEALKLVETQYQVKKGSLLEICAQKSKKAITAAFDLLRPTTQLR